MLLSRKIDDKEIQLKNQSQAFFQISGAGHEAVLVAAGAHLRGGYDWFFPYYRDRALCLAIGVTPLEMLLASVGAKDDPGVGRPPDALALGPPAAEHSVAEQRHRHAVPARGRLRRGAASSTSASHDIPDRESRFHDDEVTYVSIGDGATSEGEFWESLNTACTNAAAGPLPVRGQRLRDLGPGGSADAGRRHLAARRTLPRPARVPVRRHRLPRQLPDAGRGGRARARPQGPGASSTPPSSARTRTRSRTTRSCTRRRPNARRRRGAIRCCGCGTS